ncbi:MAG: purine biosynthesis protein PurH [Bacteroidia bacterium]|nr:purine biosynthesis protein PurH [Bacteroidia bacterium]
MSSILIKDTTPMDRIRIVKEALDGEYDEFYDDYVDGKKELAEINREYSEQFAGTGTDE